MTKLWLHFHWLRSRTDHREVNRSSLPLYHYLAAHFSWSSTFSLENVEKFNFRIKWITILLYNSKTTLFGFPHVILSRLLIVCCAVLYLRVCEEWWATCCAQADHRPSSPAAEAHLSATQQEKLVTNKKPTHISIDSLKLFTKFHYHFTHIMNEMNTALLLVVFLQRVVTMEFSKKQIDIFLY